MPRQDKIAIAQIIGWLILLIGIVFSAGQSYATLNIVREAVAELKPEVVKHGKSISAIKAILKIQGD